jgi:hypothetical protein
MTNSNEIREALLEILSPKKDKKAKKLAKYVLVVDGRVLQSQPSNKTELEQATIAIKIKNPSSKIVAYKLQGELTLNLPVSGIDADEIEGA